MPRQSGPGSKLPGYLNEKNEALPQGARCAELGDLEATSRHAEDLLENEDGFLGPQEPSREHPQGPYGNLARSRSPSFAKIPQRLESAETFPYDSIQRQEGRMMSDWETLGAVEPRDLIDAQAAAPLGGAGGRGGRQAAPAAPARFQRAELHLDGRSPRARARHGDRSAAVPLGDPAGGPHAPPAGRGRRDAGLHAPRAKHARRGLRLGAAGGGGAPRPAARPAAGAAGGLPDHPVVKGAPFSLAGSAAPAELERYYAGADRLLRGCRDLHPGSRRCAAGPITSISRC